MQTEIEGSCNWNCIVVLRRAILSHQLDFVTVFTCNTEIERDAANMEKGLLDESAKDHLCQRKELGGNSCNF